MLPSTPSADLNPSEDNGVGLSDSTLSQHRRKMLDLINRLHTTGLVFFPLRHVLGLIESISSVQTDMDLPMIAVIGSQSAGKSSLIESISGITLPRSAGTCTRSARAHFVFRNATSNPIEGAQLNVNFHARKTPGSVSSNFTLLPARRANPVMCSPFHLDHPSPIRPM